MKGMITPHSTDCVENIYYLVRDCNYIYITSPENCLALYLLLAENYFFNPSENLYHSP